jgi:hypothetical protein
MTGGGGSARISLGGDNAFPVNFGQAIDGLATNGAGGLNFSYSTDKHNRTYISYLINGNDRDLEQESLTEQYTDEGSFLTGDETRQNNTNLTHNINFGLRRRIDSTHNLIFNGNLGLIFNELTRLQETGNWAGDQLVSSQLSSRGDESDRIRGDLRGSYNRMIGKNKSVLKFSADASYSIVLDQIRTLNQTDYISDNRQEVYRQYQENDTDKLSYSFLAAYTRKIGKGIYLDPMLRIGGSREKLDREQGSVENGMVPVDSVSPVFHKDYRWIRPGFSFRWNTLKSQLSVGIAGELGSLDRILNGETYPERGLSYFVPSLSWDYSAATGRKLNLYYSSSVNIPTVNQLMPVVNTLNPLNIYYGNPALRPEYKHSLMVHWLIFDQFSFTSFMFALSGGYTRNKINWSTSVTDDLVKISTLTNVDRDYDTRLNMDFSTPIRKLGIKINLNAEESWNRGQSLVNQKLNVYNTLNQRYSLSADNRKKKQWDVESGLGATLTHTWYDIQESLDNRYFDLSWFADIRFTPNDRWHFELTADITSYSDLGSESILRIPLIRAEVNYYFLAQKRGVLTLSGFDLLDRNQNVQRLSELNYLRETRSNTIGRYVMLSFRYRLSKHAREGGIQVELNKRR